MKDLLLSVIVPFYNDEAVIPELIKRLHFVLANKYDSYEVIFIDDGSTDNTWNKLVAEAPCFLSYTLLKLIRNVGQQNALTAGLDVCKGDLVILMDSDLQDRPEDIPVLVDSLLKNPDAYMAIAKWIRRDDTYFKKVLSRWFNRITLRITSLRHHENLGIFRVIRKSAIQETRKYVEKTANPISLFYWIGFNYVAVDVERDPRFAGQSGYSISKMISVAAGRIFSYSLFPIRLAVYSGIAISAMSFIGATYLVYIRLTQAVIPGWTSIIVLLLFLFGINFIFLGIIGEYLGKILLESKNRPRYHIDKTVTFGKYE